MNIVTVASDPNNPGLQQLQRSCDHFGYNLIILVDSACEWGRQQIGVYNWAKQNPGVSYVYVDGYDTFFVGPPEELKKNIDSYKCKMLVSGEGVIFPNPLWEDGYDDCESPWKYVNGGCYWTTTDYFVKLIEGSSYMTATGIYSFGKLQGYNDQDWLTIMHLALRKDVKIDTQCKMVQPLCRIFFGPQSTDDNPDFTMDYKAKRLINNYTGEKPVILHGNGGAVGHMKNIYEMI